MNRFQEDWRMICQASRECAIEACITCCSRYIVRCWADVLRTNASTYVGLFSGLWRVKDGKTKKARSVFVEWDARTRYSLAHTPAGKVCQWALHPLIKGAASELYTKWAGLLLRAAEQAGIERESETEIVLNETSALAYIEWDGEALYCGDRAEVISPAWYQNGHVLEQGNCRLIRAEESDAVLSEQSEK